jgi:hypothetical protein
VKIVERIPAHYKEEEVETFGRGDYSCLSSVLQLAFRRLTGVEPKRSLVEKHSFTEVANSVDYATILHGECHYPGGILPQAAKIPMSATSPEVVE